MDQNLAKSLIEETIQESIRVKKSVQDTLTPLIAEVAQAIANSISRGGKLILFGNGGSAGDAQHNAAELLGRFEIERRSFPAIALTTNTSTLTAIGNDYGYDTIFSRQVEGLANADDVVIGISTSGNSPNVINAIRAANHKGTLTVGLTGEKGGALLAECTHCLRVPSSRTARIQESHIMIGHLLCLLVEQELS